MQRRDAAHAGGRALLRKPLSRNGRAIPCPPTISHFPPCPLYSCREGGGGQANIRREEEGGGIPRVTFRRVVVSLRGPGQSPVLPFACCVGSLRSVGRCGRCSCWCPFRVRGAQSLAYRGCAGCCPPSPRSCNGPQAIPPPPRRGIPMLLPLDPARHRLQRTDSSSVTVPRAPFAATQTYPEMVLPGARSTTLTHTPSGTSDEFLVHFTAAPPPPRPQSTPFGGPSLTNPLDPLAGPPAPQPHPFRRTLLAGKMGSIEGAGTWGLISRTYPPPPCPRQERPSAIACAHRPIPDDPVGGGLVGGSHTLHVLRQRPPALGVRVLPVGVQSGPDGAQRLLL